MHESSLMSVGWRLSSEL